MEAGPLDSFNHVVSLVLPCETQDEIDRLWDAHFKNGGQAQQCGWLKDRWVFLLADCATVMFEMTRSPDRAAGKRAVEAMMQMVKFDIAAWKRAFC